jgi:hypothetical protein
MVVNLSVGSSRQHTAASARKQVEAAFCHDVAGRLGEALVGLLPGSHDADHFSPQEGVHSLQARPTMARVRVAEQKAGTTQPIG